MKIHIKHGELRDELVVEEEDLEETEHISINKVLEIFQSIPIEVKELKRIIKSDDATYGK